MNAQMAKFMDGCQKNGHSREEGQEDLGPHGAVRRVRLQQVALGGLRLARVSDGLPEGELPRLLHGRAAHRRNARTPTRWCSTSASARRWASPCCPPT
jgi:hypothetical protein